MRHEHLNLARPDDSALSADEAGLPVAPISDAIIVARFEPMRLLSVQDRTPVPAPVPAPLPAAPRLPRRRRAKAWQALLVVVPLLGGVALGWWLAGSSAGPTTPVDPPASTDQGPSRLRSGDEFRSSFDLSGGPGSQLPGPGGSRGPGAGPPPGPGSDPAPVPPGVGGPLTEPSPTDGPPDTVPSPPTMSGPATSTTTSTTTSSTTTSSTTTSSTTTSTTTTSTPPPVPVTAEGVVNGCNAYGENCDGNPIYRGVPPPGYNWSTWPLVTTVDNGTTLKAQCWRTGATVYNYSLDPLDPGPDPYESAIHFRVQAPDGQWGWIPDTYFVRDEIDRLGLDECPDPS